MSQVTAKQAVWLTFPSLPLPRIRRKERVVSQPKVSAPTQAGAQKREWLEDLLNLALLCILAGAAITATAWIGREFVSQILQIHSMDLLRGFGAM